MLDINTYQRLKYLENYDLPVSGYRIESNLNQINKEVLIQTISFALHHNYVHKNTMRRILYKRDQDKDVTNMLKELSHSSFLNTQGISDLRITPIGREAIVNHKKELYQVYKLPTIAIIVSILALIVSIIAIVVVL